MTDISLIKLRAFVAVADSGSFSKAAEALGVSQPSISRMLSDLESDWGLRLFDRGRGGAAITQEGESVLQHARDICIGASALDSRVAELSSGSAGHLRIGTFSSVATHWLPPAIRRFQEDHPKVSYELLTGDYYELDKWVLEGRVDMAFTRIPTASDGLDSVSIADDEMMAVLPKGHPLAENDRISPEQMCGFPFMLLEKGGKAIIGSIFDDAGLKPDVRFVTWDDYAVMSMVESGMGIGILPSLILKRMPYDIDVRPLDPPVHRHIGVITRHGARLSKLSETFLEYVKESIGTG